MPEKVIRCMWCKQHIIKELTTDFTDLDFKTPYHPDCHQYGRLLIAVGWVRTRDYHDTPETRKAMREQFHAQANPQDG